MMLIKFPAGQKVSRELSDSDSANIRVQRGFDGAGILDDKTIEAEGL